MELLTKSSAEFASVGQRARAELAQLETRLAEMFESEISKIDQKYQAKYFNYFMNKPTSLLNKPQLSSGLQQHMSNPFPSTAPASSQPLPASSQPRATLKRSRSAFGEEGPIGPSYSVVAAPSRPDEGGVFLHTDASPPCVRPRISANLTPQSPKVTKAALARFELPRVATAPREEDQYSMTSYSETDAERKTEQDEQRRKRRAKKKIPDWCRDWQYMAKMQQQVDPDAIFLTLQAFPKCDLKKIFGDKDKYMGESTGRAKKHRGSSGNWGVDGLTDLEITNYKKLMGQVQPDVFAANYELSLNITSISSKIANYISYVRAKPHTYYLHFTLHIIYTSHTHHIK